MHLEHFGLRTDPFPLYPSLRFVYMSTAFEEAMAHMAYGLEQNEDIVLITGPIGTGKTLAIHNLLANVSKLYRTAFINVTQVDFTELLKLILADLDAPVFGSVDRADLLGALKAQVRKAQAAGGRLLVVIDEAQNLSVETLEGVRLLTNLGHPDGQALQLILSGQTELERKVNLPPLAQLRQRIRVHYRLETLGRQELDAYVAHRLKVAGCERQLFRPKALDLIYEASSGVPRLVNILASRALLSAFVAGKQLVDVDHVDLQDLPPAPGVHPAAAGPAPGAASRSPPASAPPAASPSPAAPPPDAASPTRLRSPAPVMPAWRTPRPTPPLPPASSRRDARAGSPRRPAAATARSRRRPWRGLALLAILVVVCVAAVLVFLPRLRGGTEGANAGGPDPVRSGAVEHPAVNAPTGPPATAAPRERGPTLAAGSPVVPADSLRADRRPGKIDVATAPRTAPGRPDGSGASPAGPGVTGSNAGGAAAPAQASPATRSPGATPTASHPPSGGPGTKPAAAATQPAAADTASSGASVAIRPEHFAVHVHSFRDRQRTDADLAHLREAGYPCFTLDHVIEGVTWERIYVGPYRTLEAAEAASRALLARGDYPYTLVVKLGDESR